MKVTSMTWGSDISLLVEGGKELGIELDAWSARDLEDERKRKDCINSFEHADVILLRLTTDKVWDEFIEELNKNVPIIPLGRNTFFRSLSNVSLDIVATENLKNMLGYIGKEALGRDYTYEDPKETMWQGIYHPDAETAFASIDAYLQWYKPRSKHKVGIIFSRTLWANGDLEVINTLIHELEKEFDVFPAFCYGMGDVELGAKTSGEVIEEFFLGRLKLDALINLQSVFNAGTEEWSTNSLKELDVLVFHPLMAYYKTEEEWRGDSQGLSNLEVGLSVAMPEFEGIIEPIIIGVPRAEEEYGAEFERHVPINERVAKIVGRMKRWIVLKDKQKSERKVAFILHNTPCASVEATVGSAAHLDALESVARILKSMKEEGYSIPKRSQNTS
jgi:cobaltochelatase CobN